jgi:DNA-binding beta-propeller fold protein YncE
MPRRDRIRIASLILGLAIGLSHAPRTAAASGGIGDLYVSSDASDLVRAYGGNTGTFLGIHASGVLANGHLGLHFGDTNNRLLVGSWSGGVDEFDATTGAYIKTYNTGGGWQWAGLYAPNGTVLITSTMTNEVLMFDPNTGAPLGQFCPIYFPSDMRIGPNGNLFVCSFGGGFVEEHDINTGNLLNTIPLPVQAQANDVTWLPNGDMLVTAMRTNLVYRFDSLYVLQGSFTGTGWGNPHGIDIHPTNGRIYVVDGITTQVHVFDPVTFAELDAAHLAPNPGDKIVDLEFRRYSQPVNVQPSTWSRIKTLTN